MSRIFRITTLIFLVFSMFLNLPSVAQSKKFFVITGKIMPEVEGNENGSIEITKNGKETTSVEIPKNGRFRFELDFFNEYSLNFKYPGHFNKIIQVSTEIPEEVWKRDNDFPPFPMIVQLTKEFEGVDKSFTLKPSGRIFYGKDIDNFEKESFINELQFLEQSAAAKNQNNQVAKEVETINKVNEQDLAAKQKEYDQIIKEADAHYQRGEYQLALIKYLEAKKLFPERAYPNDRVAELQDLVKALEISEKQKTNLEEKYKLTISKANGFYDQKSYKEARPVYEEALQYKPGDVFATGRINEIDKILALYEKQNQYKKLIASADNEYKSKNYDPAISFYNQAKILMPEEKYPQSQIDIINLEKQEQAKQAQIEKTFNQTMLDANASAKKKDYNQALNIYQKALSLRPDNQEAKDKVKEIEQVITSIENDKKYGQIIVLADQALAKNDLTTAKTKYQEALDIKQDNYPKGKLSEIAQLEANESDFKKLVEKGETEFNEKKLDDALNTLVNAQKIKPQDQVVKKRIDEIQGLKQKAANENEFKLLISKADQSFEANEFSQALESYNKALEINKNEAYPKDQISKINNFLALQKKADKSYETKNYNDALAGYNNLLNLKPKNNYAISKIQEIEKIQEELKQKEEKEKAIQLTYENAIKAADQLFSSQNYNESIAKYKEALSAKSNESYPQKKLKEIESILDKLEKDYQSALAQGDKNSQAKDYNNAMAAFNTALQLKPNDAIAKAKIDEIQKIQLELKQLAEKAKAEQLAYDNVIKTAEQLLIDKKYNEALNKFKEAQSLKSSEAYPPKRIKEIETTLDGIEKEKVRLENEYKSLIAQADNQFEKKDYANAQNSFQKALSLKPDQNYPTDQLKKIDQLLAEIKRQEAETLKLQQEKTEKSYNEAIANGDKAFGSNDFNNAQVSYKNALTLKPNDPIAKKKLGDTEAQIAQIARNTIAYNKAITEANNFLTTKKYLESKEKYEEALQYLPSEDYPKRQIGKINELLAQEAADIKLHQDYTTAINEGNLLLKNKDLANAKLAFTKAFNLIPTELLPQQKIREIDDLIAEQQRIEAAELANLEAYKSAVKRADTHFASREYSPAQMAYSEALILKPNEKYPQDQLDLIKKLLNEQNDKNYKAAIFRADNAFNSNQLAEASANYQEALKYKKDDQYVIQKLKDIEKKRTDIELENARLKKLSSDFIALVADADNDFRNKNYQIAKEKYQKALEFKPDEIHPKEQITNIDAILAGIKQVEENNKQFALLLKQGEDNFKAGKLVEARDFYQKANVLKPEEPIPPIRIAEIDHQLAQQKEFARIAAQEEATKKAKEKADKDTYDKAILAGDKDFNDKQYQLAKVHYSDALIALPNEKYPKDQITKCNDLLAQEAIDKMAAREKERQDSIKKSKDFLFDSAITMAKKLEQNEQFEPAISKYNEAISIKPDHRNELLKVIDDIKNKMQLAAQHDAEYKRIMKLANSYFTDVKLNEALTEYQNALKIKPNEEYPKSQIKEIQNQLAAREQKYSEAITAADKAYNAADWANARTSYIDALKVKPDEEYPANRLKDVNQKIADANMAAISKTTEEKAYNDAIAQAEKAFKADQLSTAKLKYQEALSIKPKEELPAKKIKEIDALIEQRNKERLAQQQRELDEKYQQTIVLADNSYKTKKYTIAKLQYQQALLIKPNEEYPKTQIALMDKLMNESKPQETYISQVSAPELPQNEKAPTAQAEESVKATEIRAENFVATDNYDDAIKKADQTFNIKDYAVARFYYYKAAEIKPSEDYPKKQIEQIKKLIDSQMSASDIAEYDKIIAQADQAFGNKTYTIAKFFYYKALNIKSWEKYPKDRINEINALTHSLLSEKEENEYKEAIAKADEALVTKDIAIARFYYNKALRIKSNEDYPKIKLKDIQKMIDQHAIDKQNELFKSYIDLGDQAMQVENFTVARFNYNKALSIKPNEKYPKDQLKALKEAIDRKSKEGIQK